MKKLILILALFIMGGLAYGNTDRSLTIINNTGCDITVTLHAHDACTYSACGSLVSTGFLVPAASGGTPTTVSFWNVRALISPGWAGAVWTGGATPVCGGGMGCMYTDCGWDWASIWLYGTSSGPACGNVACSGFPIDYSVFAACTSSTYGVTWYDDGTGNITITVS